MTESPAEITTAPSSSTERLRQRLADLATVARTLGRSGDARGLYRAIYREAGRLVDNTGFILYLYDARSETVEVVWQVDSGKELPGGSFPLGKGFTSEVIRTGRSRLIREWSSVGPRVQVQYATDRAGLPESGVTVALHSGRRVIGAFSVQSYQASTYDEDDVLALEVLSGFAAIAIDRLRLTDRLDNQLHRRVSELETILASMADGLLIVDASGRVMRLNPAARALLASSAGGIVLGQPVDREQAGLWALGTRVVADALGPMIESLRRGEKVRDVEVELGDAGGQRRFLTFTGASVRDARGGTSSFVIIFRDVTDRREVERIKDEVLAIASHDLKTPVTAIKGQAELLARRLLARRATDEDVARGLTSIAGQSERLAEMLNLLLDLSRIEAGHFEVHRTPTDLAALSRAMVEVVRPGAPNHQFSVVAPDQVIGGWDEQRLGQVLQNLIANAIKYSPDGGPIELIIEDAEHEVTVRVRDRGIGLAKDDLERIFARFYRAESIRRLEGAGLGLYICQEIVTAHGGQIRADSAGPGQGSEFSFTIPRPPPTRESLPAGEDRRA